MTTKQLIGGPADGMSIELNTMALPPIIVVRRYFDRYILDDDMLPCPSHRHEYVLTNGEYHYVTNGES